MKRFLLSGIIITTLFCGCAENEISATSVTDISEISEETTATTEETTERITEATTEETTKEITVSFPETEASLTEIPETTSVTEPVLNENQLYYSDKNIEVLMEFLSAEEILYYPRAYAAYYYKKDNYVLHTRFTVTNPTEKSFMFSPSFLYIFGANGHSRGTMLPISKKNTGLISSDVSYDIAPNESVSFDADFIGEKVCIEYAYKISYDYTDRSDNAKDLSAKPFKEFRYDDRVKIKPAVRAALLHENEKAKNAACLVPKKNEYSIQTDENSCCFSINKTGNENYIRINVRIQCLTGHPERFDPGGFRLVKGRGDYDTPSAYGIPHALLEQDHDKYEISGIGDDLLSYPFDIYVGPDGKAEYDLYYFLDSDSEENEYYMFEYIGENDEFKCYIDF